MRRKRAYTLIELLISLAIAAILVAIVCGSCGPKPGQVKVHYIGERTSHNGWSNDFVAQANYEERKKSDGSTVYAFTRPDGVVIEVPATAVSIERPRPRR